MFPNVPPGFSLTKLIGGISKSLTIANQVIPIYQQLSPMVKNARKAFGALKEISSTTPAINNSNNTVSNKKSTVSNNPNRPSFFQ